MAGNNPSDPILENPGVRGDGLGGNTGILLEFSFPWCPGPLGHLQSPSRMGENSWDVFPWFQALEEDKWRKFEIPDFWGFEQEKPPWDTPVGCGNGNHTQERGNPGKKAEAQPGMNPRGSRDSTEHYPHGPIPKLLGQLGPAFPSRFSMCRKQG